MKFQKRTSYKLGHRGRRHRGIAVSITTVAVAVLAIAVVATYLVWPKHTKATPTATVAIPRTSSTTKPVSTPPVTIYPSDGKALGFAAGSSLPALSEQALNTRLSGMEAAGATWVRFDFDWSTIQPNNSTSYDWAPYDRVVASAVAHHLQVLGIIDYTPAWARASNCGTNKCPPASDATYAQFAAALSKRYAPQGVHDWEIWNEPNNPSFWQPGDNPSAYVGLLKAAYSALHTADLHAYVITGGLSPQPNSATSMSPVNFLSAMYNDGASGSFDAIGDHPYTFPLTPTSNADDAWTQMAAATNSLRSLMVSHSDAGKKIWITEFGSPTGGPGPIATVTNPNLAAQPYVVDQGLQAKILSDAITEYKVYSWAGPFFYYTYQDSGTDQSTNENFFGLVNTTGAQKQAYAVFQQAAASLK